LQKEYRSKITSAIGYLTTAVETNSNLENQLKENKDKLIKISRGQDDIAKEIPNASDQKTNEKIEQLKQLLDKWNQCTLKRNELKEQYRQEIQNLDLSPVLMSEKVDINKIKELVGKPLNEIEEKLKETFVIQETLLSEITTVNQKFLQLKSSDRTTLQRDQAIHSLNQTCEKFKDIHRRLSEGLKFYDELISEFIAPLKQEVNNFVVARETERDILLADLGTNIGKNWN